jgi:hypothetical protein
LKLESLISDLEAKRDIFPRNNRLNASTPYVSINDRWMGFGLPRGTSQLLN